MADTLAYERERARRAERALAIERDARLRDITSAVAALRKHAGDDEDILIVERLEARGEMLQDLMRTSY